MRLAWLALALSCLMGGPASADATQQGSPVGELHLVAHEPSAALRSADHGDRVRVTVWYPAAPGAQEQPLAIGPPGHLLFDAGSAAPDAPPAEAPARHPVVLLSHGFGGTARVMGWFGTALARTGTIVVAVDHPGNNAVDKMTVAAVVLWWDRVADLRAALHAAEQDARIGPDMDMGRVGVAGFSAGGGTALLAAGARVDMARLERFCAAHPDDGVCAKQVEFSPTTQDILAERARPEIAAERAHEGADHTIPEVRAAFAMAPALVQALDPDSLRSIRLPVAIALGDADTVAPPPTNGTLAAGLIPQATLTTLPGVTHYDFLSPCTPAGIAAVPQCRLQTPRMDRAKILATAVAFFNAALGSGR